MDQSIKPACRNPAACASNAADRRFEQNVTTLVAQGSRAVTELLRHLGATTFRMTAIEATVARYAGRDPELLRAVDVDRFPPRPALRLVRGRYAP